MSTQLTILIALVRQMRLIAVPEGQLHPFWDAIYEIEAYLAGRPTVLKCTVDEYVIMARRRLGYL